MSAITFKSGELPQIVIDKLKTHPQWATIEKELQQEASIDERLKPVLQKCLENDEFKKSWNKVRNDYGRHPDVEISESEKGTINNRFVKFPTNIGVLEILRPPVISLPTSLFPAHAICALAVQVFELSEQNKLAALNKMLPLCTSERLKLDTPISEQKTIRYQVGSVSLEIEYAKDTVKPEVNVEFKVPRSSVLEQ